MIIGALIALCACMTAFGWTLRDVLDERIQQRRARNRWRHYWSHDDAGVDDDDWTSDDPPARVSVLERIW